MARARNIKPSTFLNTKLADCEPLARLLFMGLWTIADREGRLEDEPKKIKAQILPYDNTDTDILLSQLAKSELIIRYQLEQGAYIQIIKFTKHQQPHYKEMASIIPPPPLWIDSGKTAGGLSESVRKKILERDGACNICQAKTDLSIDHIIPRSLGGSHDEENLQVLCRKCNSSKNNRLLSTANLEPTLSQPSCSMTPLNPLTSYPIPLIESIKGTRLVPFLISVMPEVKKELIESAPHNYVPDSFAKLYEEKHGVNEDRLFNEFEKFAIYFTGADAKKPVKKDWLGAWRNWITK